MLTEAIWSCQKTSPRTGQVQQSEKSAEPTLMPTTISNFGGCPLYGMQPQHCGSVTNGSYEPLFQNALTIRQCLSECSGFFE